MVFDEEDRISFEYATSCYICYRKFLNQKDKVRDHDHLTGKYRGAAHSKCNLFLRKTTKIPVFLHNFRGYDSHIICLALEKFPNKSIKVIGQNLEKYLTMNFGKHIVFKDSYQFLGASLAQLANNLFNSGGLSNFHHIKEEFLLQYSVYEINLLLKKGVYPYEYMNDWSRFQENKLPAIEEFSNKLRNEPCSPQDYNHAQNVWKVFSCQSMEEYHNLYLKTDVYLLTAVFEAFRKFAMQTFRLDPAHYVSSPQLSWDSMLLFTNVVLDLIWDPQCFK